MSEERSASQALSFLSNDREQTIVFALGETEFGVPITQAVRIVRVIPMTRVPRAPAYLEGVINVEGTVVPVVDLKQRLALPQTPRDDKARIVIVETKGQRVGMIVDWVTEILPLPTRTIEPAPSMIADINGVYLTGVARLDHRLLILLDLTRVLTIEEVDALKNPAQEGGAP
jgi:purine-binding chemotaxis protein CheW